MTPGAPQALAALPRQPAQCGSSTRTSRSRRGRGGPLEGRHGRSGAQTRAGTCPSSPRSSPAERTRSVARGSATTFAGVVHRARGCGEVAVAGPVQVCQVRQGPNSGGALDSLGPVRRALHCPGPGERDVHVVAVTRGVVGGPRLGRAEAPAVLPPALPSAGRRTTSCCSRSGTSRPGAWPRHRRCRGRPSPASSSGPPRRRTAPRGGVAERSTIQFDGRAGRSARWSPASPTRRGGRRGSSCRHTCSSASSPARWTRASRPRHTRFAPT